MKEFDPGDAPSIASLTDKVRALPVGMPVTSIHFLGDTAVFVGAEENAAMVNEAGEVSKVAIHGGAVLCAASDGKRIVTGGDDGKVVALERKGRDVRCSRPTQNGAGSTMSRCIPMARWRGRRARPRSSAAARARRRAFDAPSTVGGLAFAPKGLRVAVAHYNGVTLWFPNMAAKPEFLEWAGSHLGVTFSPDNKFLVTAHARAGAARLAACR